jgi:cyclase
MGNKLKILCSRLILITWLLHSIYLNGQPNKLFSQAKIERVADGVYAIIHADATDEWPHGNTGVIIGNDAVMVIDACYLPSMAREDIRLIRTVTKKPVRYLAYTHWHFDHTNGSIAYNDSFPGIRFISARGSSKFTELNATWWAKRSVVAGSSKRSSLSILEKYFQLGKDSSGKSYSSSELTRMKEIIAARKNELEELASLKVITPDYLFDDTLIIDLGRKNVQLVDHGKANSPHDVTFYIPENKILFTGDILVQSPLPYFGASWPVPWIKVLQDIENIPVNGIVPGHGPVQLDHSYTRLLRQFLQSLLVKVELLIWEGKTIEQVQQEIDMDVFKRGPWEESNPVVRENWKTNLNTIIERVWRGIRGQG